jgi:hypothetical protein
MTTNITEFQNILSNANVPDNKATFYSKGRVWTVDRSDLDLYEREDIDITELLNRASETALLRE